MGGLALAASPSSAPANTIFLGGGPVSERLTMVTPAHAISGPAIINDLAVNGSMMNRWTSWNPSFFGGSNAASTVLGSFTTAPDGTNTAQHIAATTINDVHFVSAAASFPTGDLGGTHPPLGGLPLRVAFIARATELTRCMMQIDDMQGISLGNQQGNANGAKTVFDLAGGQIGVANTAFGSGGSVAGPASVILIGQGFYLCSMDCQLNFGTGTSGSNGFRISLYLDNGSGTGAQSTSFTGDGTSGIYIWKSSCLPPVAFSLTGVTFFDDFTDPAMGTIDLNNTLAPGFNWYIANSFTSHGFNALAITPKAKFSQSGSILTINFSPTFHDSDLSMETAVQLTPSASVLGKTYAPPALFESMCAYDMPALGGDGTYNSTPTFWTVGVEVLTQPDPAPPPSTYLEYDFFEAKSGGASGETPNSSAFQGTLASPLNVGTQGSSIGTPKWSSLFQYGINQFVWDPFDGNIYQVATGGPTNLNKPPHSNPTFWTLIGAPTAANLLVDYTAQNLFSTLWLPWNTPTGPLPLNMGGTVIQFFNNIAVGFGMLRYGPTMPNAQSTNPVFQTGDKFHYPIFFGCAQNASIYIDFARVIQ